VGLIDEVGAGLVALDTAAFIYFIEEHPLYLPPLLPVFAAADEERRTIVTSAVTLLEVLVVLYRAGNLPLANRYEALLSSQQGRTPPRDGPRVASRGRATPRDDGRANSRRAATRGRTGGGLYGLRDQRPPSSFSPWAADTSGW
jgi:hypothetical protein